MLAGSPIVRTPLVQERVAATRRGVRAADQAVEVEHCRNRIGCAERFNGVATGDVVNDLLAISEEPNVRIMETKALVCDIGPAAAELAEREV